MLPAGSGHKTDWNGREFDSGKPKSGILEQPLPARPHEKANVCPVEKSLIVLRKSPEQDVGAEPEIPAVRKRGDQCAAWGEDAANLAEQRQRVAEMLEDVGAEHVIVSV